VRVEGARRLPESESFPQVGRAFDESEVPAAHAGGPVSGRSVQGAYSPGTAPEVSADGHDGAMAGLDGTEQPRGDGRATVSRWSPTVEDERALKAVELFGNPTEA